MLKATRWKIWYDDGSTFASEEGLPKEAPSDGIIAIVEKRENKTVMIHQGSDYYYWAGENWLSGQVGSLDRWLRKELPNLKYGRWTNDGIFREAMEEAKRWP